MKIIGTMREDVAIELQADGFKMINTILINGKTAYIFANNRSSKMNKYTKEEIFLTNKLRF